MTGRHRVASGKSSWSAPWWAIAWCGVGRRALIVAILVLVAAGAVAAPGARQPDADIEALRAAGNEGPAGIWSDGTTLWVVDNTDNRAYAYELASGARTASRDIETSANSSPTGLWSDGTTLWVLNYYGGLHAYDLATGEPRPSFDRPTIGDSAASGLWSDGRTFWVAHNGDDRVRAYDAAGLRDDTRDIQPLADGSDATTAAWSDGVTLWVADQGASRLYAYGLASGARAAARDIALARSVNAWPMGVWSDGETVWVSDWTSKGVYAYGGHDAPGTLSALGVDPGDPPFRSNRLHYPVTVGAGVASVTVAATAADGGAVDMTPADADPDTAGHQVDVSFGASVEVAASGGPVYRVAIERLPPPDGALAAVAVNGTAPEPFSPAVLEYGFEVPHDVATATVAATAAGEGSLAIAPADADASAPGHQVRLAAGGATTVRVVVTDAGSTTYTLRIARPAPAADASLRWLSLSDVDIGRFDGARTSYAAQVRHGISSATVTARAAHGDAAIEILPADAEERAGHQVSFAAGDVTRVTVAVTATDGTTSRSYAVDVSRAGAGGGAATAPPMPDELSRQVVMRHIRDHGIGTVEAFVEALPAVHRTNFTLVYDSGALFRDAVSHETPRVVSWGANADMVFAWTTDADSAKGASVEFLRALEDRWVAGLIDFGGAEPELREPAGCATCHGAPAKPLWGQWNMWRGTESEVHTVDGEVHVIGSAQAATRRAAYSSNPRLSPLEFGYGRSGYLRGRAGGAREASDGVRTFVVPFELGNVLAFRHERVLLGRMRARSDYAEVARDMMCAARNTDRNNWMDAYFATDEHHLSVRADNGEMVQGAWFYPTRDYGAYYAYGGHILRFLVLDDLYRRDERVAQALRDRDSLIRRIRSQHYAHPVSALLQARRAWGMNSMDPGMSDMGVRFDTMYDEACSALGAGSSVLVASPTPQVVGFTLVDAAGEVLRELGDGAVLETAGVGAARFALRVDVAGAERIAGVEVELVGEGSGLRHRSAVGGRPLIADLGAALAVDQYYVSATPYPEPGLRGPAGATRTVRFSVSNSAALAAASNGDPAGLWSDGETVWVADATDLEVYAYDLATGGRLVERDIVLDAANADPSGLWSNGQALWVADKDDGRLYAYFLSGGARYAVYDIELDEDNAAAGELWSNGETVWVIDTAGRKVYAYDLATGTRLADDDIRLADGNDDPTAVWSDGATLWVADGDGTVYAYDAASNRVASADFDAPDGIDRPAGLWSDGRTAWLVGDDGAHLLTAALPEVPRAPGSMPKDRGFAPSGTVGLEGLSLTGIALAFERRRTVYRATAAPGLSVTTVTATAPPLGAVSIEPADAAPDADGHQVALADGFNTIRVTVQRGVWSTVYTVLARAGGEPAFVASFEPAAVSENESARLTVALADGFTLPDANTVALTVGGTANDADYDMASSLTFPPGTNSAQTTVKVIADRRGEEAETIAVTARLDGFESARTTLTIAASWAPPDIDTLRAAGNRHPRGIWSDGDTMWVADIVDDKLYAYALADGVRRAARDIGTLRAAGNRTPTGLWSDGETIWVVDQNKKKFFAYALADGERRPGRDVVHEGAYARGLWSDGEHLLAADRDHFGNNPGRLYRYRLADGRHIGTWAYVGGGASPWVRGLWSDGEKLWVGDFGNWWQGVNAFDLSAVLAQAGAAPPTSVSRLATRLSGLMAAGNTSPIGIWSNGRTMWVADQYDAKLYAYRLPTVSSNAALTLLRLEGIDIGPFSPGRTAYSGSASGGTEQATLVAFPASGATLAIEVPDADPRTPGWQVALGEGETAIGIRVTAADEVTTRTYTVTVGASPAAPDASIAADASVVTEGAAASFTVTLATAATEDVTVAVEVSEDGAMLAAGQSASVVVAAGSRTATLSVPTSNDDVAEPASRVTATVAAGEGYALGTPATAAVVVEDDESLLTAAFSGLPTDHDGAAFEVELRFSEEVAVDSAALRAGLAVDNGRVAEVRPLSSPGTIHWTIGIEPADDGDVVLSLPRRTDCTATGAVCTPGGKALSGDVSATVAGPEAIAPPSATVAAGPSPVTEGGDATFVVTLDRAADVALTVSASVGAHGAALAGTVPETVAVAAGERTGTLSVATVDDRVVAADGTVTATLLAGEGYGLGAAVAATVTVADDDTAAFEVAADPAGIGEGDGSTVTVRVTNGATFAAEQRIGLTVSGVSAQDYTLTPETLTLAAGAAAATARFEAAADAIEEETETALIEATLDGAVVGSASVAVSDAPAPPTPAIEGVAQVGASLTTVFQEEEPPPGLVYQWLRGDEQIAGATGSSYVPTTADVARSLSVRTTRGAVSRTSAPTAPVWPSPANPPLAGGDEELLGTVLTLESADGFKVDIAGYGRFGGEPFGSLAGGGFDLGGTRHAVTAAAVNNQGRFVLGTSPRLADADGLAVYWNGHRMGGFEAATLSGKRYWEAATTQPKSEYGRYWKGASDGVRVALSIRRPEPVPTVSIAAVAGSVAEGGAAAYTVTADEAPRADLAVSVSVTDEAAVLAAAPPTTATVAAGAMSATLALATDDDTVDEADGAVTVDLLAGAGYELGTPNSATTTVADDDEGRFEVTAGPAEIAEGGAATVTVAVADGVTFAAAVGIELAVTGGVSAGDYELAPVDPTLAAGEASVSATLTATADDETEEAETATVTARVDGVAVGSAAVTVRDASDDASLADLSLTDVDIGAFDPEATAYAAEVLHGIGATTVEATPGDANASVEITDAVGSTSGTRRTSTLAEGANGIAARVTAEDGATTRSYAVTVTRAAAPPPWGTHLPERDIALGGEGRPTGLWSDGSTLWAVTDWDYGEVRAYRLTDGVRLPDRDVTLSGDGGLSALWSDGSTLMASSYYGGVYAYGLSDGARRPAADPDLPTLTAAGNDAPVGLWSDGTTLWVADNDDGRLYAYGVADGARSTGREFGLRGGDVQTGFPWGLWTDGETVLVSWFGRGRVLAYRLSDGARRRDRDIDTGAAGNDDPRDLWSDGETLWVLDGTDRKLYAYAAPGLVGARRAGPALVLESRAAVVPGADPGPPVSIADGALRGRIEAALGKAPGEPVGANELAALEVLNARDAGVTDLAGLEGAVNLTGLDLGGNAVRDLRPLASLPALASLSLDATGTDPWALAGLARLVRLSLRDNGIEDLGGLSSLVELEELDIGGNRVADLTPLAGLAGLRELRADGNRIADLAPLAGLAALERLDLGGNPVARTPPGD